MPKCSLKLALLRYLSTSMQRPKMGDLEKQTLQKPPILGPAPPAVTRIPVSSATSAARQSLSPNLQLHHGPAQSVDRRITASSATNAARQSLLSQLIGIVRSAARIMTVSSAAIAVHPVHKLRCTSSIAGTDRSFTRKRSRWQLSLRVILLLIMRRYRYRFLLTTAVEKRIASHHHYP